MSRTSLASVCKAAAASAIASCAAVAAAAAALTPPAVDIADFYLAVTAVFAAAAVVTATVAARQPLSRERRLLAVVLLGAIASSWYAGRMRVHEKQFDQLVQRQKTDLELAIVELAGKIGNFLNARARTAPPPPRPSTWDDDVGAVLRYEDETSALFEQRFGDRVRKAHDLLALEGIRDRDFDTFYRQPANAFQIRVVTDKLRALARRVPG